MHYDSFVVIYGKDRANGAGAKIAADAVEDLDNDTTDNNDEQMNIIVDVDLDVELKDDVVDSTCQAITASQSRVAVSSKRRKNEAGKVIDWHATLGRFETALAGTRAELKGIADYFMKETQEKDRKGQVYSIISQLDGFIVTEMLTATTKICKEPYKIDIFFGLPMHVQRDFVKIQLGASNEYRPTLDF